MGPASGQRSRTQVGTRSAPRSGAGGLSAIVPARPVRVDLGAAFSEDPLAPVPGWGVELADDPRSSRNGFAPASSTHALGDLVDKAGAQLMVLRRTLDEATSSDRIVRQHMADLMQRIQQGQRFGAELDRRLQESGKAALVLEKAATTLRGLEAVVEQLRGAQAQLEQRVQARLNEQSESFAKRLGEMEATFEARLIDMQARCEETMRSALAGVERTTSQTREKIDSARDQLASRADGLLAHVDRHAAQAQARVSLILDGASDRLATMEEQAERLGGASRERLDDLCARAVELLGHDPRVNAQANAEPTEGSLAYAVTHAQRLVDSVDEAGVRIGAIKGDALSTIERLDAARQEVESVIERAQPVQAELAEKIDATLEQARINNETLQQAIQSQQQASEAACRASDHLSRQREDLEAIGAASAYHVSQAREASTALGARVDFADARLRDLDRAMESVTEQAESMVDLARRVATLIEQAKPAPTDSSETNLPADSDAQTL